MTARVRLMVRKVFGSGFSWYELEDYFSLNRNTLENELKESLRGAPNFSKRLSAFLSKIKENENTKSIGRTPAVDFGER